MITIFPHGKILKKYNQKNILKWLILFCTYLIQNRDRGRRGHGETKALPTRKRSSIWISEKMRNIHCFCLSISTRCQKIWYCFTLLMHKSHFSKICIREISCRKVSFKKIILNPAYVIILGKILKFLQKWIELTWLQ